LQPKEHYEYLHKKKNNLEMLSGDEKLQLWELSKATREELKLVLQIPRFVCITLQGSACGGITANPRYLPDGTFYQVHGRFSLRGIWYMISPCIADIVLAPTNQEWSFEPGLPNKVHEEFLESSSPFYHPLMATITKLLYKDYLINVKKYHTKNPPVRTWTGRIHVGQQPVLMVGPVTNFTKHKMRNYLSIIPPEWMCCYINRPAGKQSPKLHNIASTLHRKKDDGTFETCKITADVPGP
jgi:hypothetical protein